jgi:Zn-dependent protease with chaperone function
MSMGRGLRSALPALALSLYSAVAVAALDSRRDPALEVQYAAEVRTKAEVFAAATAALDAGRNEEAEKSLREVLAVYPKHGPTLWRLAALAARRGQRDEAVSLARRAVEARPGEPARTTLAESLMMGSPSQAELIEIDGLLAAAAQEATSDLAKVRVAMAKLLLAGRRNDMAAFRDAVSVLRQLAPDEAATHYFSALDLASSDDLEGADKELELAVARGLPREQAQKVRDDVGITHNKKVWRWAKIGVGLLAGWLAALLLIYGVGSFLSRAALQAIERFGGRDSDDLRARTGALRAWYKRTIAFAAVYYFVSIPVVIAVVLLLAGGLLLGLLMLGHIPIKLLVLVAIIPLVTIWAMLKSLIVRRAPEEDPGRLLAETEAPALWAVLREVAGKVGTRPVDSVYLTIGTDMAVTERGSMSERLRDRGKRSLILGVGLLSGFSRSQFRAVLAHEYGHFSNRDTAGGNTSMVVQASLMRSLVGIAQGGGAAWYNPAWLFLRGFYLLFLRITLGASRLQELMADHFAAVAYGAEAFRQGLMHVVRRSLEFSQSVAALVTRAEATRRALISVYATPEGGLPAADLDAAVDERMKDKGSPYDSHPPPAMRIAWVSRIETAPEGPPDEGPVWELFADRVAIEAEMTALANERLLAQGVIEDPPEGSAAPELAQGG